MTKAEAAALPHKETSTTNLTKLPTAPVGTLGATERVRRIYGSGADKQ